MPEDLCNHWCTRQLREKGAYWQNKPGAHHSPFKQKVHVFKRFGKI